MTLSHPVLLSHGAAASTGHRGSVGWHPTSLILVLTLWISTVGNLPLWLALGRLPELHNARAVLGVMGLACALVGILFATLAFLVWPRWLKPAGVLLLATVTASSYFMAAYGIVIDPSMMANVAGTDAREVRDLLTPALGLALFSGLILPGVWWWRQPLRRLPARRLLGRQALWALLAFLLAVAALAVSFQDLASLMRNHKSLRYMINPYNTVYAIGRHSAGEVKRSQQPLQTVGADAHIVLPTGQAGVSPLIVLVVGETARAANFGLGGYARDTTPRLKALQAKGNLVYFPQVTSCGTNTETSLPCMFSHLDRNGFVANEARYENLLDILKHAGMSVLWLDNQSGCKGVCDRVPHVAVSTVAPPGLCESGECQDMALLRALPGQLAAQQTQTHAAGTVVVLHQMGSHGPAYSRRSPANLKTYAPECASSALQACQQQEIVNAYDNSLRATDDMLAETIGWLESLQRPTMLLYVSDHGESLGEKGLYLHGMPYSFAPDEQTHVPMLTWMSPAFAQRLKLDATCLKQKALESWSHDNLFHTVLDLAQVETSVLSRGKSVLAGCNRNPVGS
ncbi:phosphoethanolamine--lipid A transferase [Rhodoferax sp.]|uniref:phosphoethanolamine transferase n=1 Tax=Rhodoferax sp. TaxID=50421 RepID=UPI0025CBAA34|nr:phosphoethanolamine--lipid A transferase [Rhodoferax sp.]